MNCFGQTKGRSIYLLWCFLIVFSAACRSATSLGQQIVEVTPLPTPVPPVEYGASLSEWEAAAQANSDQTVSRDEADTGTIQSQAPVVATATTASTTADKAASAAGPSEEAAEVDVGSLVVFNDVAYREIMWDSLVPADFTADAIMAKYADQLAQIQDGDPEAYDLYTKMQEEFNNAPVNETLNETLVRLPGFIAPLEYTDDLITEFLLVPYFGACIHVPPPPANQTVLVKTSEDYGIKPEDSFSPVWVMGKLTTDGATTQLAEAGYYIQEAIIEPYIWPNK